MCPDLNQCQLNMKPKPPAFKQVQLKDNLIRTSTYLPEQSVPPPCCNKSSVICRYLFETLSFFPALQVGVDAGWRQSWAAVMTLKLLLVDIYSTWGRLWGSTHDHIGFIHVGVQLLVARLPRCFQVPVCFPRHTHTHKQRNTFRIEICSLSASLKQKKRTSFNCFSCLPMTRLE